MKANKEGWIRHRGGKCPVEAGTLVDVRYRSGDINIGVSALTDYSDKNHVVGSRNGGYLCFARDWNHGGADGDIMAWKLHAPSEQPATVNAKAEMPAAKYFDGPLQWRDRITEIDAESKAEAERHCQVMTALDSERAELMQRLASEGLAAGDMNDPANWKAGDLLECICCPDPKYTEGKLYSFLYLSDWGSARTIDNDGNENGIMPSQFKWHSRPTN